MSTSVATSERRNLRDLPERGRCLKVQLRKSQNQIGKAIVRARSVMGWTQQQMAAEFSRDEKQIGRWESGDERAPIEELLAHEAVGDLVVTALAEQRQNVTVETVIHLRRLA